jgi:transcriptional regulator with XRE-family HTH domain
MTNKSNRKKYVMYSSPVVASLFWDAEKATEFARLRQAAGVSFRGLAEKMAAAGTSCNFNALRDLEKNKAKTVAEDLIDTALKVLGSSAAEMFGGIEMEAPKEIPSE